MNSTSRFQEHFEDSSSSILGVDLQRGYSHNNTNNSVHSSSNNSTCLSPFLYMDQYDIRRQSLSNTIDADTTNSTTTTTTNFSINDKCDLKRKSRVKKRRPKEDSSLMSRSSTSSSIMKWCKKQKTKIFKHL